MARIDAGGQFGRDVAPSTNLASVPIPRAAFGSAQSLDQAGQQVMNEGLRQERQQQQEAEQARRAADRAQAQAKFYGVRDQLDDAMAKLGADLQEGALDKTKAADEWAARSKDILAGALDGVPEQERQIVGIELQSHAQRITSKVGDFVRQRDRQDTVSALNSTLEYTQRLAVTQPDQARQIMRDTLQQLGPFSGLTADQLRKAEQGWVEQTSYTRAFTAVNAAKSDNKALTAVEQGLAQNTDLDPQRKAALLAQIDGYRANNEARAIREAQRAEIAAQRAQRESSQAFSVLSAWALSGKAANPEANASLIARLTPTDREAYKALAAEVPARAAAAMLPLDVQQQQLDSLKVMRNDRGTDQRLEQEITRREQVLNEARREYQQEPLRAAQERGILDQPLQPLRTDSIDGLVAGMAVRVQQAQTAATRVGRAVSPLLSEEASRLGDMLNGLAPAQRAQQIARLAEVMPAGMTQALAQQIDGKDKGLALELALGTSKTTSGRYTAEWVARGRQAIKDKAVKDDGNVGATLRKNLAAELGNALTGKAREDVIEAARLIHVGLQAAGDQKVDVERAVSMALDGKLINHAGGKLPIPAGWELDTFRDALRGIAARGVRAQAAEGFVFSGDGRRVPVDEFVAALPEVPLLATGTGRYQVPSGVGVFTNAQGRPIEIKVR